MTKGTDIRELALGILLEVSEGSEYSHIALRNVSIWRSRNALF